MFVVWMVFHVIVSIALVLVVLMQSAKGEGLAGSMFGGGGLSGAVFGGRGAASFLSKATTALAVVFFLNCIGLAYMSATPTARTDIAAPAESGESAITRQAQAERDRMIQQQQEQIAADSASPPFELVPQEGQGEGTDTATQPFRIEQIVPPPDTAGQ